VAAAAAEAGALGAAPERAVLGALGTALDEAPERAVFGALGTALDGADGGGGASAGWRPASAVQLRNEPSCCSAPSTTYGGKGRDVSS
jgi:hypothetical protein